MAQYINVISTAFGAEGAVGELPETLVELPLPVGWQEAIGAHIICRVAAEPYFDFFNKMVTDNGFMKLLSTSGSTWYERRITGTEMDDFTGWSEYYVSFVVTDAEAAAPLGSTVYAGMLVSGLYDEELGGNPGLWLRAGGSIDVTPDAVSGPDWEENEGVLITMLESDGAITGTPDSTPIGIDAPTGISMSMDYDVAEGWTVGADVGPVGSYATDGAVQKNDTVLVRGGNYQLPGCDIGNCYDNSPIWTSHPWSCFPLNTWKLTGTTKQTLQLVGPIIDAKIWHEDDTGIPGPWASPHRVKVKFSTNNAGLITADDRHLLYKFYDRPRGDSCYAEVNFGSVASPEAGDVASLIIGNDVTPTHIPITILPDTSYILEFDFLQTPRVRFYEDETTPPGWLTGTWSEDLAPELPTFEIRSSLALDDTLDLDTIWITMPPTDGQTFIGVFIAEGDGQTVQFKGFPTVEGTAKWDIDGVPVTPSFMDEATGTVVFDRAPAWLAHIKQSGKYRAGQDL